MTELKGNLNIRSPLNWPKEPGEFYLPNQEERERHAWRTEQELAQKLEIHNLQGHVAQLKNNQTIWQAQESKLSEDVKKLKEALEEEKKKAITEPIAEPPKETSVQLDPETEQALKELTETFRAEFSKYKEQKDVEYKTLEEEFTQLTIEHEILREQLHTAPEENPTPIKEVQLNNQEPQSTQEEVKESQTTPIWSISVREDASQLRVGLCRTFYFIR